MSIKSYFLFLAIAMTGIQASALDSPSGRGWDLNSISIKVHRKIYCQKEKRSQLELCDKIYLPADEFVNYIRVSIKEKNDERIYFFWPFPNFGKDNHNRGGVSDLYISVPYSSAIITDEYTVKIQDYDLSKVGLDKVEVYGVKVHIYHTEEVYCEFQYKRNTGSRLIKSQNEEQTPFDLECELKSKDLYFPNKYFN